MLHFLKHCMVCGNLGSKKRAHEHLQSMHPNHYNVVPQNLASIAHDQVQMIHP